MTSATNSRAFRPSSIGSTRPSLRTSRVSLSRLAVGWPSAKDVRTATVALKRRPKRSTSRPWVSGQTTLLSDALGRPLSPKTTPATTEEVRRAKRALLRRAKDVERACSKWLRDHDGADPRYRHLATSTGRIGHLSGLQADSVSMHYLAEVKNVKMNATIAGWWQQICEKAIEWGKDPILMWEASNASEYKVRGKNLPVLHIITAERHEELLRKERQYDAQQR